MTIRQMERRDKGSSDSSRYMVIASDTHAGPRMPKLRKYFEQRHWPAFDEHIKEVEVQKAEARAVLGQRYAHGPGAVHKSLQPGGHPALEDPAQRLRDLDADGVAGEVIFPDFPHVENNEPPFGMVNGGRKLKGVLQRTREFYSPELQWAGAQAYNRWLAEFCSVQPERRAGLAIMPFHDVHAAVGEIQWARKAGLRGVLLPALHPLAPGYNDPMYEPIWSTCEDLRMPLHTHGGHDIGDYGKGPDAMLIQGSEVMFLAHRPLWWFIWGGILERHPRLALVFAEQSADWVASTLLDLERTYSRFVGKRHALLSYSLSPRGYWDRQCYVGATAMKPAEAKMRHEVGIGSIMWGSDYPHPEGTWPYTRESLRYTFAAVPEAEVRLMLGENAAKVYQFDAEKLAPIVERIGPSVEEVAEPLGEVPKDYIGSAFR